MTNTPQDILLMLLPFFSVSLVQYLYPMNMKQIKPVFQPPNWFFSVIWTYILLSLGIISVKIFKIKMSNKKFNRLLALYLCILGLLNMWLIINHFRLYKAGFWTLIVTTFISIIYLIQLGMTAKNKFNPKLVWLLLPLPFWLVLASSLNAVIYDYYG